MFFFLILTEIVEVCTSINDEEVIHGKNVIGPVEDMPEETSTTDCNEVKIARKEALTCLVLTALCLVH